MKRYSILFYKREKDIRETAKYYREFPTRKELVEWCKAIQEECNYSKFEYKAITKTAFLENQ